MKKDKKMKTRTQQLIAWGKLIFNNVIIVFVLITALCTGDSGPIAYEVIAALIAENMAFIAYLRHLNMKGGKDVDKDKKLSDYIPNSNRSKGNG